MRRMWAAGAAMLVCLALVAPVLAQSQEPVDLMAPAGATIVITNFGALTYGEQQPDDSGVLHELGRKVTMTWESSDPRLSGEMTYDGNRDIFAGDIYTGLAVGTETYVVENDGGRWVGQATGWAIPDETGSADRVAGDLIPFRGEGGYEGLSALVHIDWVGGTIDAVIFPGDLPPAPEPSPAG